MKFLPYFMKKDLREDSIKKTKIKIMLLPLTDNDRKYLKKSVARYFYIFVQSGSLFITIIGISANGATEIGRGSSETS